MQTSAKCQCSPIQHILSIFITDWAIAPTCYKSHSDKQRKMADSDPSRRQNPLTKFDETWHGWLHQKPHSTRHLWG